jgi:hypothetical protein
MTAPRVVPTPLRDVVAPEESGSIHRFRGTISVGHGTEDPARAVEIGRAFDELLSPSKAVAEREPAFAVLTGAEFELTRMAAALAGVRMELHRARARVRGLEDELAAVRADIADVKQLLVVRSDPTMPAPGAPAAILDMASLPSIAPGALMSLVDVVRSLAQETYAPAVVTRAALGADADYAIEGQGAAYVLTVTIAGTDDWSPERVIEAERRFFREAIDRLPRDVTAAVQLYPEYVG